MSWFDLVKLRPAVAASVAVILLIAAAASIPQIRWRIQVLTLHISGKIPDIDLSELVEFMLPGSDQSMTRLLETRNPHAVIKNFRIAPADVSAGSLLYRDQCASCHRPDGAGGPQAPALVGREFKHGAGDWAIYRTIHLGVANTAMAAHPLPQTQLWQLVSFLRSIDIQDRQEGVNGDSSVAEVNVPATELLALQASANDWLTYSGSYASHRHSTLSEVRPENVGQLALRWLHSFPGEPTAVETSPIVRNGEMFATAPSNIVFALDAATGKPHWQKQSGSAPGSAGGEFGVPVNRGVAILDDRIYAGTGDAHLVARAASTGDTLWDVATSDDPMTYYISSAPLAVRDLVIIGVGTRRGGIAYIAAYDAKTGRERWRFMAIPAVGRPGHDTWAGDSWRQGGAPTWLTGSYDAEQDLLLWGVGNPKPDYDKAVRKGDNLYSDSVVALKASTGELVWHFQFTPADERDWDSNQIPLLYDHRTADGAVEKLLLWANRNGFYYVLDRANGRFLGATPFVRQTWTDGIDQHGRPLLRADLVRNPLGYLTYPGNVGGTNWWSPSLDGRLDLVFVPVLEQGMVYFSSPDSPPMGGSRAFYTAIRALELHTGKQVWEYRRPSRTIDPAMGGVLTTDTGLLFGTDQTTFFALDSRTGTELWSVETGDSIMAAPVTYAVHSEQFIAIANRRNLLVFALPRSRSRATRQEAAPAPIATKVVGPPVGPNPSAIGK